MTQSDNPLSDMNLDCHSNASSLHSMGSPRHQKENAFSACNSKQNDCLPMKVRFLVLEKLIDYGSSSNCFKVSYLACLGMDMYVYV